MAASEDLINFDVIESHKENIQALPGGRSAKKLAELYSPSPLHKLSTPTPSDTKNVNDCIRAEYEAEIGSISESDDPLDIFDRYVRWTLDAYPSAQATPQSQLHTLLERATKAFISSAQYKNDPRYLRLWMQYIHFFSDSPRETYLFLSRHAIGEGLALFYEEYAAWLEGAGRWAQADEVYKLGIEREARPVQRLLRKFKEFEERLARQPEAAAAPSSPALPTVRPALAAKADPFGSSWRPADPQAPPQGGGVVSGAASKATKSKLAIFSDAEAKPGPLSSMGEGSRGGWDTIGSMSDRKKENKVEAKPWVGETLKAGVKKAVAPKMAVFRDPSLSQPINNIVVVPSKSQVTIHPQTGKKECIFVELAAVYPAPEQAGMELSFEEIVAANRGWLDHVWGDEVVDESRLVSEPDSQLHEMEEEVGRDVANKVVVHQDGVMYDENGVVMEPPRDARLGKKKKTMEVNETQIIKAKLDSPSGPKLRKKNTSEPTMTLHTKAATDDIYEIFNAPLRETGARDETESADEDDYETDGDYTTDAESTGTTRAVDAGQNEDDEASDARSVSEWSDFATHKHVPSIGGGDEVDADERHTCRLDGAETDPSERSGQVGEDTMPPEGDQEDESDAEGESSPRTRTIYVPLPPEDYDPPTCPFRDPVEVANSRLPFMTPITERTECSLDVDAERRGLHKTPCKGELSSSAAGELIALEPPSSPLRELDDDGESAAARVPVPLAPAPKAASPARPARPAAAAQGPTVHDKQCNPVDEVIRRDILDRASPPLTSYVGFYDHREERYGRGAEIRRFAKALSKASKGGADKAAAPPEAVVIRFPAAEAAYSVKRELGAGAFAPVYLVETSAADKEAHQGAVAVMGRGAFAVSRRGKLEALKMESPPTPWEFYMMRVAHARLGPQHRAAASLSYAHEMHLYQDEAFLFLPYHAHGTLLDLVNLFRAEPSGVMDELLAMFFTVELLRTVEALHSKGVMHGDIKPDNCLLRLDPAASEQQPLAAQWRADGGGGWSSRGLVLIDFGRAIDMRAFEPDVEFVADWKTNAQDCAEMREGRPWTWQIDYHGLAGTVHCLLFGKYMETARCDEGGLGRTGRRYRIRESLKRYWQTDLWADALELLLNPASCVAADGAAPMPVVGPMRAVRERMEAWLEANCERGVGLRSLVGKLEAHAKSRR